LFVSAAKKKFCLLIKFEPTRGFNLKSSYNYSVNVEKFTLQLKLKPTGKILIGGIVGL
jgi:hypothetical protein